MMQWEFKMDLVKLYIVDVNIADDLTFGLHMEDSIENIFGVHFI